MPAISGAPKNVLILCGFKIFPTNTGGHLRTASIARALARLGHSVVIYSLAGRREDYRRGPAAAATHQITEIEDNLIEETNLGAVIGVIQAVCRRLGIPRAWQHALLARGWVPARLKLALERADIVISDMPWCPPVPGPWRRKPWLLLSHNLEHRLLEQGDLRARRFADWMRAIEERAPQTFTDIIGCAAEDERFFRAHDTAARLRLPVVSGAVDPKAYECAGGVRESIRQSLGVGESDQLLVFSGSRFAPNLGAVELLRKFCVAESAFLAQHRIFILIVGSVSPQPLTEGHCIATGRVPDVAPYFAAADAGLNAVTWGSGANVKLFEYLAARLPIISTVFGARGTALVPDIDYISFEPEGLRAAIEIFMGTDRVEWRRRAEAVWSRHRRSADVNEQVKDAVAVLPDFSAA